MREYLLIALFAVAGLAVASDNSTGSEIHPAYSTHPAVEASDEEVSLSDESMISSQRILAAPSGLDAFIFTELNTSSVSYIGPYGRGLDDVFHNGAHMLMAPSAASDSLYLINYSDGTINSTMPLAYGGAWGCYPYGSVNVNSYTSSDIYNSTDFGVTWTPYTNPAGSGGRGMDADYYSELVWETHYADGVYSFTHLSPTGTFYDLSSHIPSQMSGLAVYKKGDWHLLLVNLYSPNPTACAYVFDLANSLNYLGTIEYPFAADCQNTYGLTYCETRDTFFVVYRDIDINLWLAELEFSETSLERSTWGNIKSTF